MQTSMEKLSPYFEAYCGRIKQRRLELGLTVNELSERSGVPYSNTSRVNSGSQSNPLLFNAAAFADTMGMSLNELMGLSPDAEDSSVLQEDQYRPGGSIRTTYYDHQRPCCSCSLLWTVWYSADRSASSGGIIIKESKTKCV